ncbi:MAG TPA: glycosyltransferase, partial [Gemmataceae bacterium]|nr:glycosyltransferase [Gemmataceae bacterium]
AADVFALCSLFEMMPIALIEATASGLPCVVNRHPVLEWMTGPGGVQVDMAAGRELAAALGGLLADAGRRAGLGRAAREHCVANFSRDAVVDRILAYYRQVAAAPVSSRA